MTEYRACGLISGTSVDGIDAVVASFGVDESGVRSTRILAGFTAQLPAAVRDLIFELFEDSGAGSLDALALLNMRLGHLFAEAALEAIDRAGLAPSDIAVIGSHGQTIRHVSTLRDCAGERLLSSLQIGEGSVIAQRTGIRTVSDFRVGDIAAGGTGAPMVPFLDRILARSMEKPVVFQNFGGIGNLTCIDNEGNLLAFDTGPANMIADAIAGIATDGRLSYDRDGKIGTTGAVDAKILEKWMDHPFLAMNPPKTAGREEFGSVFMREEVEPALAAGVPVADLLRTAEAFTARATARAWRELLPVRPVTAVITGGGAHNPVIMGDLAAEAAKDGTEVLSGEKVGVSVDLKEAQAFACFGLCTILGLPNTEPGATGARRAVVSGKISLP